MIIILVLCLPLYVFGLIAALLITDKLFKRITLSVALVISLITLSIFKLANEDGYAGLALVLLLPGAAALGYCTGVFSRMIYNYGQQKTKMKWTFTSAAILLASWPVGFIANEVFSLANIKEKQQIVTQKRAVETARLSELYNKTYEMRLAGRTIFFRPNVNFYLDSDKVNRLKNGLQNSDNNSSRYFDAFLKAQNWPNGELRLDSLKIFINEKEWSSLCSGEQKLPEAHFCLAHVKYWGLNLESAEHREVGQKERQMTEVFAIRSIGNLDLIAESEKNEGRIISRTYRLGGQEKHWPFVFSCNSQGKENENRSCELSYRVDSNLNATVTLRSTEENLERDILELIKSVEGFWGALQIKPEE